MIRIPESNKARSKKVKELMESSDEVYIFYEEYGDGEGKWQSIQSCVIDDIKAVKSEVAISKYGSEDNEFEALFDLDTPLPLGETMLYKMSFKENEDAPPSYMVGYVRRLK